MDGFRTWNETESFEIIAVLEQTGLAEQMNARLFQRDKPGVWHRKGRGALTCMVEPVSILCRPVLIEPICSFRRSAVRQGRGQHLRELRRQDLSDLVGESCNRRNRRAGDDQRHEREVAEYAKRAACQCVS